MPTPCSSSIFRSSRESRRRSSSTLPHSASQLCCFHVSSMERRGCLARVHGATCSGRGAITLMRWSASHTCARPCARTPCLTGASDDPCDRHCDPQRDHPPPLLVWRELDLPDLPGDTLETSTRMLAGPRW